VTKKKSSKTLAQGQVTKRVLSKVNKESKKYFLKLKNKQTQKFWGANFNFKLGSFTKKAQIMANTHSATSTVENSAHFSLCSPFLYYLIFLDYFDFILLRP
jgi:hypothetical protein